MVCTSRSVGSIFCLTPILSSSSFTRTSFIILFATSTFLCVLRERGKKRGESTRSTTRNESLVYFIPPSLLFHFLFCLSLWRPSPLHVLFPEFTSSERQEKCRKLRLFYDSQIAHLPRAEFNEIYRLKWRPSVLRVVEGTILLKKNSPADRARRL